MLCVTPNVIEFVSYIIKSVLVKGFASCHDLKKKIIIEQKHERSCDDPMGSGGFTYKKNVDLTLLWVDKRKPWSLL